MVIMLKKEELWSGGGGGGAAAAAAVSRLDIRWDMYTVYHIGIYSIGIP